MWRTSPVNSACSSLSCGNWQLSTLARRLTPLMNSQSAGVLGVQTPTYRSVPDAVSSAGQEAIDLAASAGLILDEWQENVLLDSMGERRSEEHTSELQSRENLVCRLLLEKKKKKTLKQRQKNTTSVTKT